MPPSTPEPVEALVRRLYEAIAAWDVAAIDALLDPGFQGELAEGMPLGLGGRKSGSAAMRDEGWRAIGHRLVARAEPHEWIPCVDGRLLVLGRYTGWGRASGRALDAGFAHLWTGRDGRLVALRHYTDTARWHDALGPEAAQPS
jgi:2-(1,2-epoxy-1,2-dihydrophenyl)acetyl-CoA isomerase